MIIHKREFFIGMVLLLSFLVVLGVMMSPVMNGKTFIAYADELFNALTKGSTYAIPSVMKSAEKYTGKAFQTTLKARDDREAEQMSRLFTAAGATVKADGVKLAVSGDLGRVAKAALSDADMEFKNQGSSLKERYGMESRQAIYYWWNLFSALQKQYKAEAMAPEMSFTGSVMTKALEPAYNFEGIPATRVAEKPGITVFMLGFYVIYTIWYGFAMMFIFEGLGITATGGQKAEV
ncbi:hypothetical protein GFC01_12660 [Desulfofundulus thermobenzoicus]|uniref:Uncharacterized protein n=1 Tax=Desulfofundulus thermobenzoicus TaxID=29376 RepID=A0A6N7IT33_9FIRM|nr:hypothetical protein [Desulfofundulus thermobenzoicus]MQL53091.1 hypothetical protein [Desulfofundulus thermobenzoicus]HHW42588.1 hypothetical protein [Desulfotomaculum sp.]